MKLSAPLRWQPARAVPIHGRFQRHLPHMIDEEVCAYEKGAIRIPRTVIYACRTHWQVTADEKTALTAFLQCKSRIEGKQPMMVNPLRCPEHRPQTRPSLNTARGFLPVHEAPYANGCGSRYRQGAVHDRRPPRKVVTRTHTVATSPSNSY